VARDIVLLAAAVVAVIRMALLQRRVRALEEQTITDPLTGAFNRRHMHTTLAAAVERRRRSGDRASLLMLDIDRFKDINDALGHAEGDRVLKCLVALVGQRLRKVDALFRAGGEEFILLLSGTGFTDAVSDVVPSPVGSVGPSRTATTTRPETVELLTTSVAFAVKE